MKTILFQGDSITDACRLRDNEHYKGHGYATILAGRIGVDFPGQFQFINRGVSGDRSIDIYARIKQDILNLKPDYLTILLGVNDVWHGILTQNGVDPDHTEIIYDLLLRDILQALPNIRIFLLEPFLLPGSASGEHYNAIMSEVQEQQAVTRKMAERYCLPFVPLQSLLSDFADKTSCEEVLYDGVHPTYVGHTLIAEALYDAMKAHLF